MMHMVFRLGLSVIILCVTDPNLVALGLDIDLNSKARDITKGCCTYDRLMAVG